MSVGQHTDRSGCPHDVKRYNRNMGEGPWFCSASWGCCRWEKEPVTAASEGLAG